jgi:hypothetical protein
MIDDMFLNNPFRKSINVYNVTDSDVYSENHLINLNQYSSCTPVVIINPNNTLSISRIDN